jgi:cellulose synthase/poly-beta-1,6-N-acetylglucosamine synthase-like glycosyltransferase
LTLEWQDTAPQVLLGIAAFYALVGAVIAWGLARLPRSFRAGDQQLPRVSVVVAARNEAIDLPACLAALLALDYPPDRLEIVLVDDDSSDGTAGIMADAAAQHPRVRMLSTRDAPATHLRAKARGVAWGARHAAGEWLFITDADGTVAPGWLRHMLSRATPRTGIIGAMMVGRGGTLVGTLERASWAYTLPWAFGAAGWGFAFICVGPNMAIRRSIYEAAGGLEAADFTIAEDLALFRMAQAAGFESLGHASPETTVHLTPVPSLRHLLSQQRRWLRGGFEGGWRYGVGLVFAFGYHMLFSLGLLAGWWVAPGTTLAALGLKAVADLLILVVESRRIAVPLWRLAPLIIPFTTLSFLWLPVSFLISRTVRWRGEGYAITYRRAA